MDGEILFSDVTRFKGLKESVESDLKDRKTWFKRAEANRVERYRRKNTEKPIYPGAPNIADPVIADMIRDLKQSILTTLWQAPRLAQFIGLDKIGVANAETAEAAFDFHLRIIPRTRARIAQCVDDELTYGHGIAKLIERAGRGGMTVPDFVPVSPLAVVVPTCTGELGEAERVCHMMRYTVSKFRKASKAGEWNAAAVAAALTASQERKSAPFGVDRGNVLARYREGALSDSGSGVDVWEIFYETDLGRRVCLLCPDCPDVPLIDKPWIYVTIVGEEDTAPERAWPFVQFKNEDVTGFYNSSGVPEILEDDQKEASCYRNVRAVALDFCGKPFLKGQKGSQPFRFRAGENVGNQEVVFFKSPGTEQIYQQEYARNLAMKRVGSAQGFVASVTGGDQRKTATEIDALMSTVNGMSVDAVERFAEPWAEMFAMMWHCMSRQARLNAGRCGMTLTSERVLKPEVWKAEFAISAGVSGRSVNQHRTLAALTNLGQLAPVLENMTETLGPASVRDFYLWILNTLDTELARKVMASATNKGASDDA